ncbi:flagellar motor switch protein FliN [bacterium]|jgi:flagellar motor switch protein FliN|nr:flagellar motor switch protein FliN [bacterium]
MSDDNQSMLSQNEIDALLQGDFGLDDLEEEDEEQEAATGIFTPEQMRTLLEIADTILVKEISVFSDFINREVALSSTQQPQALAGDDLKNEILSTEHLLVTTDLDLGKSGIVITGLSGAMLTSLMTDGEWDGDPDFEFDEFKLSALQDCFNGLMQKVVPALKIAVDKDVVSSPPQAVLLGGKDFPAEATLLKEPELVQIIFDLSIGDEPPSQFRYILSQELAKQFLLAKDPSSVFDEAQEEVSLDTMETALADASQEEEQLSGAAAVPPAGVPPAAQPGVPPAGQQQAMPAMDPAMMQQMMQQMMAQQGQVPPPGGQPGMPPMGGQQMSYSPWQFPALSPGVAGTGSGNMDLLKDVSLQVTVELGRATMPIGQILELLNGSIVELNKQAGEAVELYVQGKLIARGEVVIIDENFGVRITSIVSPQERMKSMQGLF